MIENATACEQKTASSDVLSAIFNTSYFSSTPSVSSYAESSCSDLSHVLTDGFPEPPTRLWLDIRDDFSFEFQCAFEDCDMRFDDFLSFEKHFAEHQDHVADTEYMRDDNTWTCPIVGCSMKLNARDKLICHLSMHKYQAVSQYNGFLAFNNPPPGVTKRRCGYKPNIFLPFQDFVLKCEFDQCGMLFNDVSAFYEHIDSHVEFGEKGIYDCRWTDCEVKCVGKSDLRRHLQTHTGRKQCACPFCGTFFSRHEGIYDHCKWNVPREDREFMCMLCRKTYVDEKVLSHHVKTHIAKCACHICGLLTIRPSDLQKHLLTHNRRKLDRRCDDCSACFDTEESLAQHKRTHRPPEYQCDVCSAQFRWKMQHTRHMKKHATFVEKYVCHLCNKEFTYGNGLTKHLTSHHNCPIPEGFTRFTYRKCNDGYLRLQTQRLVQISDQ